ncbi:MAG: biotin--[acetyl-CoA-carboxylase] ligase [Pseudomonadota bacterium]
MLEHRRLQETGSTNDDAHTAFASGAARPLLISAEQQTAGKGRYGRSWSHDPLNFAGSFLVDAGPEACQAPGAVSLLAGLAVRDTLIAEGADAGALALKWPNDVLMADEKVAGILSSFVQQGTDTALIIGIGVNLASPPSETVFPARAVFAKDRSPDPEGFGDALGQRLVALLGRLETSGSWAILEAWRSHAWRLGDDITIRRDEEEALQGRFEDIDREGRLMLRRADGSLETIAAGDAAPR